MDAAEGDADSGRWLSIFGQLAVMAGKVEDDASDAAPGEDGGGGAEEANAAWTGTRPYAWRCWCSKPHR